MTFNEGDVDEFRSRLPVFGHVDILAVGNEVLLRGELTEDQLSGNGSLGASEAVQYGIANWYHYNGNVSEGNQRFQNIVDTGNWAAFGYIAAEADLSR